MRSLWGLAYAIAARCYTAYARRGEPNSGAFVKGSFAGDQVLHGLSDIDVVIVVAPDPAGTGRARERVRRRLRRVSRGLPVVGDLLFGWPSVYEAPDLADAVAEPVLTYGLSGRAGRDRTHAVYSGPHSDDDKLRLAERPQLYGPTNDWRLLAGFDRRPPPPTLDADHRRIAAWLELQYWWQWAFDACARPDQLHNAYLCVKLLAESVRAWLWLERGERVETREQALVMGPAVFPEEGEAFERAGELRLRLRDAPAPPLAEFIPVFLRLSDRIARELGRQVEPGGWTEVRLEWSDRGALAVPDGGWPPDRPTPWDEAAHPLLPLADWRAIASPSRPDDAFFLVEGDPGDPGALATTALALAQGPYPTLTARGLQVRPARMGGRLRLRTIQCAATDPASFALAAGESVARFPKVPGFSLEDTASRAVAEHAAWLAAGERDLEDLGRLITAARAGLLWESIEAGDPELQLTMEATLDALGARGDDAAGVAEAAREHYREFAVSWRRAPEPVLTAMSELVSELPAYAFPRQVEVCR
jgi:hypothetical protein